jgi:CubicO group peptidase (beta-lactamase class C family)
MTRWISTVAMAAALAVAAPAIAETVPVGGSAMTAIGATFTAPADWTITRAPKLLRIVAPEGDVIVTLADVGLATDAAAASALAWKAAMPDFARKVKLATPAPAREGWEETVQTEYETSPNEKRAVVAFAQRRGTRWTVLLLDGAFATLGKRSAAFGTLLETLRPDDYVRETFAGRTPYKLDAAHIAQLKAFIADSMTALHIPGAGYAFIQDGRIVDEGGIGVRELGKPEPVDANTRFMIASNTKGMTTLLLAELVDQGKLRWDEPVVEADPNFRLADPVVTRQVLVRHLVCACTGMPRQDNEWILGSGLATPAAHVGELLAAQKPTSGFGAMYQYSNLLAASAGYLAGHIAYPDMELGAAYDRAMRERVFAPLHMTATTFDKGVALAGDHAAPHGDDFDGHVAVGAYEASDSIYFARPAGGAWSTAHDVALYALNELNEGRLADLTQLLSPANLLARRMRGVGTGEGKTYGMGLENNERYGVRLVTHGGAMPGYMSNWMIIPEAGVGVVLLTNANSGSPLVEKMLPRRLLEILYDGKPEAAGDVAAEAHSRALDTAEQRTHLTIPADPAAVARLAKHYDNAQLGHIDVRRDHGLIFDFGSFSTSMVTRRNPDGTTSFVMADPVQGGWSLTAKPGTPHDALIVRDAQHEYVYTPAN